ncbi:GDP-L-fucose synthase [Candidatus Pelagibacter sp.]|nr:GDP-L-fucose synthase [Candidatus Pelagibacter sp.]
MILKNDLIYVAGHNGLVGSAVLKRLKNDGYTNIITANRKELDLTNQQKTFNFLKKKKPKFIFICAAKVGGILANDNFKAEFIFENLQIQNNLIHGAYLNKIRKLIFLGSSCVYPKHCKQPIKEDYLLSGKLEPTNEPYALAKIAGIKLCESYNYQYKTRYLCLMPTNTYGPGDNYNLKTSHFLPALIKKIHKAKKKKNKIINLWGSGKAKRELIYVDDLADACIFFMNKKTSHSLINIGTGVDYSIKDYANIIMKILKINLKIILDKSKPDGTPKKILDISVAKNYGWNAKTSFKNGIIKTYSDFLVKEK